MRYTVRHTLEAGLTLDKIREVGRTMQKDPEITGVRSFFNLSEHKAVCVIDAPDRERLEKWFDDNNLPYEEIWPVEIEGERNEFTEIPTAEAAHK